MTTQENFLMVRAVHLQAIEGTKNTPTRSEDAGKTWTQEFELPPHTSGMIASCLITQDNLALVTFEHQEDQRQEEKEYEDQVEETAEERQRRKSAEEWQRRKLAELAETAEEEDAKKDRKEKWEVLGAKRGREWQRRKLAEIGRLQEELDESFRMGIGLGAKAISPEKMDVNDVNDEEQEKIEEYRQRWEKARLEWRDQAMPPFPQAKNVHWEDQEEKDETFHSFANTPLSSKVPEPKGFPAPRGTILNPAKFHFPPAQVKPWDRGGDMFSQEAEPHLGSSKATGPATILGFVGLPEEEKIQGSQPRRLFHPSCVEQQKTNKNPPIPRQDTFKFPKTSSHHPTSSQLTPEYAELQFPSGLPFSSGGGLGSQAKKTSTTGAPKTSPGPKTGERGGGGRAERVAPRMQDNAPQLAEVLTLLTNRLTASSEKEKSSEKHTSLKLPSVNLPKCKYDSSNQTTARQWYTFKYALYNCVAQHKLDTIHPLRLYHRPKIRE